MKTCNRCKKNKEDSEFVTSRGKPSTRCGKCRIDRNRQAKKHYHNWHDEVRKYDKVYYHKNRERFVRIRRNNALKLKYGITIEDYESIFANQNGKCAICNCEFVANKQRGWGGKKEPCVDHNHKTGKVRGILCRQCNLSLSMIENENFISKAQQYLAKLEKISDKEPI